MSDYFQINLEHLCTISMEQIASFKNLKFYYTVCYI